MLFETRRMYVRYFTLEDVETMFAYRSHPDCQKYQDWKATDLEEIHQFLHSIQGKDVINDCETQLAVCLKDTKAQIGDLYFVRNDETITIGYTLHPLLHHQGYGKEIVSAYVAWIQSLFPKHEIVAMVHPENLASSRLLDSLNFLNEGYEAKVDSIIYSTPAKHPALSIWDCNEEWLHHLRHIAKLMHEWYGIRPVVYGSVGVRIQVPVPFQVHDLDLLIPHEILNRQLDDLSKRLWDAGYQVTNDGVLTATVGDFEIEFSSNEAWQGRCDFLDSPVPLEQEEFDVLSVRDLTHLYEYLYTASFREEKKKQNDLVKIALLKKMH